MVSPDLLGMPLETAELLLKQCGIAYVVSYTYPSGRHKPCGMMRVLRQTVDAADVLHIVASRGLEEPRLW